MFVIIETSDSIKWYMVTEPSQIFTICGFVVSVHVSRDMETCKRLIAAILASSPNKTVYPSLT